MAKDERQNSYAEDMNQLQAIVDKLSRSDCDIDELLKLVNDAAELIEKCQNRLAKTGVEINEALDRLQNTQPQQNESSQRGSFSPNY